MGHDLKTLIEAGFFKEYSALTEEELLNTLYQQRIEEYSRISKREYDPGMNFSLLELLKMDNKKFLDIDLEADVCSGNKVYTHLLEMYSNASDGQFLPSEIEEVWDSPTGPIQVSFSSNGKRIIFNPEYLDDWIDEKIFNVINNEMKKTGDKFFFVCFGENDEWSGQNVIHIRLTTSEKKIIQEKFNWSFPEWGNLS
jgi:hypothetical protein